MELIKIDPSKSKNYAKIKKALQDEANETKRYEFIVKENIMKGEHIMESNAIKKLFREEPDIEIDQFRSIIYVLKNSTHRIKYDLNSHGRIIFYTNNQFLEGCDDDECQAAEFLMGELENAAGQNILVESTIKISAQMSLEDFTKEDKLNMLKEHLKRQEFSAVSAVISDLEDHVITKNEESILFENYINIIKGDSLSSLDLLKKFMVLISDEIIEEG
ncbi:hypothetical protein HYW99_03665, partial [Candidatus Woesearchaeota archaeon]|nr:hypothetical protein [Candidatus Woesearchaeota archaeon]